LFGGVFDGQVRERVVDSGGEPARRSPLQQSELADALGHAPRSVTQSVEALERDGLVERTPSAEDRRSKLVALTPQGATALAAGTTAGQDVLREIFGALGDDELALLDNLLDAIDTAMSAAAEPRSAWAP